MIIIYSIAMHALNWVMTLCWNGIRNNELINYQGTCIFFAEPHACKNDGGLPHYRNPSNDRHHPSFP